MPKGQHSCGVWRTLAQRTYHPWTTQLHYNFRFHLAPHETWPSYSIHHPKSEEPPENTLIPPPQVNVVMEDEVRPPGNFTGRNRHPALECPIRSSDFPHRHRKQPHSALRAAPCKDGFPLASSLQQILCLVKFVFVPLKINLKANLLTQDSQIAENSPTTPPQNRVTACSQQGVGVGRHVIAPQPVSNFFPSKFFTETAV